MVTQLTNAFKEIADGLAGIQAYHFGYHSDINTSITNVYNPEGQTGQKFPLCLFVAPPSAAVNSKQKQLTYDVELFFYDTQNYTTDAVQRSQTMCEVWDRLERIAIAFLHSITEAKIHTEEAQLLHDAHAHIQGLCAVGLTFKVTVPYGCDDYGATVAAPFLTAEKDIELEYGT